MCDLNCLIYIVMTTLGVAVEQQFWVKNRGVPRRTWNRGDPRAVTLAVQ